MQDYRYDRVNSLAAHEAARQEIARKMAAFEAQHGPVETTPILATDKRIPYRISCPERKQQRLSDEAVKVRSRAKVNEERQQVHARNIERIQALANCQLNTKEIAKRTGLSASTVGKIIREIRDAKHAAPSPV